MAQYKYRELRPTPEAEAIYRRWLAHLNEEFTRHQSFDRRADIVRDELYQMYLAGELSNEARHPSQLYEFTLEGIVMFSMLWFYSRKPRPRYAVSGLFALMYGLFRFSVEFVREPDLQLGFIAFDWLTMGQILSLPLIIIGIVLLWISRRAPTTLPPVASIALEAGSKKVA